MCTYMELIYVKRNRGKRVCVCGGGGYVQQIDTQICNWVSKLDW